MKLLTVSSSPHIRAKNSTSKVMLDVLIALVPTSIAAVVLYGFRALLVLMTTTASAIIAEYVYERLMKKEITILDNSAAVTGLLLGLTLNQNFPLWMCCLGSVIAIVVVKQLFGGIGQNFANPALTARIVLVVSFGAEMGKYAYDGVTGATPMPLIMAGEDVGVMNMLLGTHGGCIGETCAIALLIGLAYLLYRRVISLHIPVAYIGTVAVFALLAGQNVLYHCLGGGLLIGAIFMATDYSTSPMSPKGKIIYGVGCGLITMLIRLYGSLPEGVSFAILFMNIMTPHIDRLTQKKALGGKAI